MQKFAKLISITFHFHILGPLVFTLMLFKFPLEMKWIFIYGLATLLLAALFPYMVLIYFMQHKRIDDYDISNRQQRYTITSICSVFMILYLFVSLYLPIPEIYKLNAIFAVAFIFIFGLITHFWKISYHLGVLGWFTGTMVFLFEMNYFILLVCLTISILTAASRVALKKHTPLQTFAGYITSLSIYAAIVELFIK